MTKAQLYNEINLVRRQISAARSSQKELEQKQELVEQMKSECNRKMEQFLNSVDTRKRKLSAVDVLINKVKAAANYKNAMQDILNGREFIVAKNSISEMINKLSNENTQLIRKIEDLDKKIRQLEQKLRKLQREYANFKEA